jgi:hypothetical protein
MKETLRLLKWAMGSGLAFAISVVFTNKVEMSFPPINSPSEVPIVAYGALTLVIPLCLSGAALLFSSGFLAWHLCRSAKKSITS